MQIEREKIIIEGKEFIKFKLKIELLNLSNKDILKDIINKEINNNNKNFIFDFSEIKTLNSSSLGILIGILNLVKKSNGILKFSNYNDRIKNIFEITRLNLVFDLI